MIGGIAGRGAKSRERISHLIFAMNVVLEKILQTKSVDDGNVQLPLHSYMDAEEGALIDQVFRTVKPDVSLETGFAYGISTLFVCDALAANGKAATHIVIDPAQNSSFGGIGLKNVARAGYEHFIDFREEWSEIALPSLLACGTHIQAAIIDGGHTFDNVLVDFFYINKILTVGGIVILDDTDWPSISRIADHISTYPAYELFATTTRPPSTTSRTKVRRALARYLAGWVPKLRRAWDYPTCMAFRKVAEDNRAHAWHVDF
jgi:predicted O-methyltransferase YrrM